RRHRRVGGVGAANQRDRWPLGRRRLRLVGLYCLDLDHGGAVGEHAEPGGGGVREIDQPVVQERSAVVHAYDRAAAVLEVAHAHVRGQRQGPVRGGHRVHVVGLAARGAPPVKLLPVPGGDAAFPVTACLGERFV